MRSISVLVAALALVAAACGAPDSTALAGAGAAATDSPTSSTRGGSTSASTVADDRPVAPDFTLALGDGGTFTLSQEQRPVYMVFWAEW